MNPKKIELKQVILRELGTKFDDEKAALEGNVQQVVGARTALIKSVKNIQALSKVADREADEGAIPDLKTLELVKLYITRAMDTLALTARNLDKEEMRARGRLEQADNQIKFLEKLFLREEKRLVEFQTALARGEILDDGGDYVVAESPAAPDNITPLRPDGVRPGPSIAQQRRAEEAAEHKPPTETEDTAAPSDSQLELTTDPGPPTPKAKAKAKAKKTRRRKPKGNSVGVTSDSG